MDNPNGSVCLDWFTGYGDSFVAPRRAGGGVTAKTQAEQYTRPRHTYVPFDLLPIVDQIVSTIPTRADSAMPLEECMDRADVPSGHFPTIDLLFALSMAADMALGLPAGHGVRSTYIGMHLADELGLSSDQRVDLFYAELLMDVGCTAWTSYTASAVLGDEIVARRELLFHSDPRDPRSVVRWLVRYMAAGQRVITRARRMVDFGMNGKQFIMDGMRNTSEVAARMADRLGRSIEVQQALRSLFEQWDGSGPNGKRERSIPLIARIVHATISLEATHQAEGREAALTLARTRRGKSLDPDVVDALLRLAEQETFWQGLEGESIWEAVRQLEPESPHRYFNELRLDDAARAFADFADLKSFYSAGHSRRVASLAEQMAVRLGLGPSEITTVRRAALVHDIGLVAVPSFVLHKPEERLSAAEWESLRLHPYYAERILARVPAFEDVIPLVAAHHERPDGQGYHRGISQSQIPRGARIISVADVFDELAHEGPERSAMEPGEALRRMSRELGDRFDKESFDALVQTLGRSEQVSIDLSAEIEARGQNGSKSDWPAGLSDREVEVLRLAAKGLTRKQIAEDLFVSPSTVRSHLEHIYAKVGVSTRAAATLFAVENDLIA